MIEFISHSRIYSLAVAHVLFVRCWQSGKVEAISISLLVKWELEVFHSKWFSVILDASCSLPYMACLAHVVTGVVQVRSAYAMPVCVPFVTSMSGIIFNPGTGAISDQSAKDIDPYFKFQFYDEDISHQKPVLSLHMFYRMSRVNMTFSESKLMTGQCFTSPNCHCAVKICYLLFLHYFDEAGIT